MSPPIVRYLPGRPFPRYAFVPGRLPHPVRDPRGHSHGRAETPPAAPDPLRPEDCPSYLYGVDLFNHGYYWEAHEAWESLWNACGRRGVTATFLKGLIKLAAAGVKAREGNARGAGRHAARAARLFAEVREEAGSETRQLGLLPQELAAWAKQVAAAPPADAGSDSDTRPVFRFALSLR